jgi:8-oxo-dGTP diphosphatase
MNTKYIDKLAYIHLNDKKVLTTLNHGKDTWYIPGGKREVGESDQAALIREVEEELTVHLKPETIKYYGTCDAQAHGKPVGTIVRMTCYTADFTGTLQPAAEVEKMDYFSFDDKSMCSPVDSQIFDDLKTKGLIA